MNKSPTGTNCRRTNAQGTAEHGSRPPKLSARLGALFDMVPPCAFAVDVGCDHGYIPIALVDSGKCPHALACDINAGPLAKAEENIRAAGLSEQIGTCLSNGLRNPEIYEKISAFTKMQISPEKTPSAEAFASSAQLKDEIPHFCKKGTLIIAGMGGLLMVDILENAVDLDNTFSCMILQPQSDVSAVRNWLVRHGWTICEETALVEDGKYYEGIKAVRTPEFSEGAKTGRTEAFCEDIKEGRTEEICEDTNPVTLTPAEAWFGPVLLRMHHPDTREHMLKQRDVRREILGRLPENSEKRWQEVLAELAIIEEGLAMISQ